MNFKSQRTAMVRDQIESRGIKDVNVIGAMLKVEREKFLPQSLSSSAYSDCPLPIGCGQTISQPFMAALMSECLKIEMSDSVLEIGTGSGYQTALLRELASVVYTVERHPELLKQAENTLRSLGYNNIYFKLGDGTLGWAEFSPYDKIIITAAAPSIPQDLLQQLKDGGRLVLPVGERGCQILQAAVKKGENIMKENLCGCVFVPLVGEKGWRE